MLKLLENCFFLIFKILHESKIYVGPPVKCLREARGVVSFTLHGSHQYTSTLGGPLIGRLVSADTRTVSLCRNTLADEDAGFWAGDVNVGATTGGATAAAAILNIDLF